MALIDESSLGLDSLAASECKVSVSELVFITLREKFRHCEKILILDFFCYYSISVMVNINCNSNKQFTNMIVQQLSIRLFPLMIKARILAHLNNGYRGILNSMDYSD